MIIRNDQLLISECNGKDRKFSHRYVSQPNFYSSTRLLLLDFTQESTQFLHYKDCFGPLFRYYIHCIRIIITYTTGYSMSLDINNLFLAFIHFTNPIQPSHKKLWKERDIRRERKEKVIVYKLRGLFYCRLNRMVSGPQENSFMVDGGPREKSCLLVFAPDTTLMVELLGDNLTQLSVNLGRKHLGRRSSKM